MNSETGQHGERLRMAATQARRGLSDRLGDIAGTLTIKAVIIAVFGVCALVWPTTALNTLIIGVALLLILDGIVGLIGMLRASEHGAFLGQSILSLVVGAVLLFWPGATMTILLRLLGVWALLHGITLLWSLRELAPGDPYRATQRTVGLVLAIIGGVLLLWPGAGVVTMAWIIGIAALIIAGVLFWLARHMKALNHRIGASIA